MLFGNKYALICIILVDSFHLFTYQATDVYRMPRAICTKGASLTGRNTAKERSRQ